MIRTTPIFPLHTVLFPGGMLPLRIFETRYVDMVSECLQSDTGFGVCLITRGREVGEAAQHARVGTYARIIDWQAGADGLLQITARGEQRLRVIETTVRRDRLIEGRVELLAVEPRTPIPEEFHMLVEFFDRMRGESWAGDPEQAVATDDAVVLGNCLSGLLPLPPEEKLRLLEADGCLGQLAILSELLRAAGLTAGLH